MAPLIASTSGTLAHNQVLTINGSGFGVKSPVAPLIWDSCDHGLTIIQRGWSNYDPKSALAAYNLDYRGVTAGVAMPHSFATKYLCGKFDPAFSGGPSTSDNGRNIDFWKTLAVTLPFKFFVSWRRRGHPLWTFVYDYNYKLVDYSAASEPYANTPDGDAQSFYISYDNGPQDATALTNSSIQNNIDNFGANNRRSLLQDDGAGFPPPYPPTNESVAAGFNGLYHYGASGNSEFTKWCQAEWVQKSDPVSGYLTQYVDCQQFWPRPSAMPAGHTTYDAWPTDRIVQVNSSGVSTGIPQPNRTITIGGFNRNSGANNWRYYADIYLDTTWSRVCIGDSNVYNNCTVREMQIPSSWSTGLIQVQLKQNTLAALNGNWLYVIDDIGAISPAFQLTGGAPGPSAASLSLNPAGLIGGNSSQGTVTISSAAPAGGSVVTLSSGNTAVAQVPASVTVPQGQTTAMFNITTSAVGTTVGVVISAILIGTQTATLTVNPLGLSVSTPVIPGFGMSL